MYYPSDENNKTETASTINSENSGATTFLGTTFCSYVISIKKDDGNFQ